MKLKILGSASGMPTIGKNHAAVWLSFSGKNILFDCGEGTSKQLMRNNLDGEVLDAIAISHFHPDHSAGIFMLLQMFYLQKRKKPLAIFLPERVKEFPKMMEYFYTFPQKMSFPLHIYQMTKIGKIFPEIEVIPNDHLESYRAFVAENDLPNELKSFSFFVTAENHKVLYTSDFAGFDDLQDYIFRSELVILDAYHPEAEETIEIIKKSDTRFILTHGLSEPLKANLKELPKNRYEIADEKLEIII